MKYIRVWFGYNYKSRISLENFVENAMEKIIFLKVVRI